MVKALSPLKTLKVVKRKDKTDTLLRSVFFSQDWNQYAAFVAEVRYRGRGVEIKPQSSPSWEVIFFIFITVARSLWRATDLSSQRTPIFVQRKGNWDGWMGPHDLLPSRFYVQVVPSVCWESHNQWFQHWMRWSCWHLISSWAVTKSSARVQRCSLWSKVRVLGSLTPSREKRRWYPHLSAECMFCLLSLYL